MRPDQYIHELLIDHDCVIVPDFGGFLGNYGPAQIDPIHHRFSPPKKEISFNRNLIKNDGLLAHHMAEKEATGYQEALLLIKDAVDRWNTQLSRNQRVKIEGVGMLYFDGNNHLRFEPEASENYLMEAFGLTAFHAIPVQKATPAPKVIPLEKPREEKIPEPVVVPIAKDGNGKRKRKVRYLVYGAAAAAFLGYMAMVPVRSGFWKDTNFALSDLNIFSKVCPNYESRKSSPDLIGPYFSPDSQNDFPKADKLHYKLVSFHEKKDPDFEGNEEVVVQLGKAPVVPISEVAPQQRFRFHVIGGCFSVKENAQKLVTDLHKQGFQSSILDQRKNLWRVAIQSYPNRKTALAGLSEIKSGVGKGAWLLIK